MGRSNCSVDGKYEYLFYVDNEYLDYYLPKNNCDQGACERRLLCDISASEYQDWNYDEICSELNRDEFERNLVEDMTEWYSSFEPCDEWISRTIRAILENGLFLIALEDNEWSIAVELLQKEDAPEGFQKAHFAEYVNAIKLSLLRRFDRIGVYAWPWTSGFISREPAKKKSIGK